MPAQPKTSLTTFLFAFAIFHHSYLILIGTFEIDLSLRYMSRHWFWKFWFRFWNNPSQNCQTIVSCQKRLVKQFPQITFILMVFFFSTNIMKMYSSFRQIFYMATQNKTKKQIKIISAESFKFIFYHGYFKENIQSRNKPMHCG